MEATRVKIGLRSMVAILFDRYSGVNDQNDQEAQKNALLKVYRDDAGNVCIPATCLKAAIREASALVGKKMESRKRKDEVRACLFISPEMIPIGCKEPDGIHAEIVTRKGQGNKVTRVVSYRPMVKSWECEVEALLYGITPQNLKQYIELAGVRMALCGHRPEWGRFEVTKFEVVA